MPRMVSGVLSVRVALMVLPYPRTTVMTKPAMAVTSMTSAEPSGRTRSPIWKRSGESTVMAEARVGEGENVVWLI